MYEGEFIPEVHNRKEQTNKFPKCNNQCNSE